jgi:UDP-N-acetylglucosamine transferase subunit ALG13
VRKNSELLNEPVPGRHLLIASTGGHLAQIVKWSSIVGSHPDSLWVTFRSPQSESLLRGRRVLYVPYVAPRGVKDTAGAFRKIMKEIDWKGEAFTSAITTGAAVGIAGLAAAHFHRVPAFYFESVSRVNGPSLTGKMASLSPWVQTFCQYESWANRRWKHRRSLFESYSRIPRDPIPNPRLFVTLGTIQPYRFDALVDAVLATGLANDETVWQLGATTREDLPGTASLQIQSADFERCASEADVVITHAGVGTIMTLLDMGIYPVVVPRKAKRKEHVDDHQVQIAGLLQSRGVSLVTDAEQLTREMLMEASANRIGDAQPAR